MTESAREFAVKILLPSVIGILLATSFFYQLKSVSSDGSVRIFEISSGESLSGIAGRLKADNLIRSPLAFEIYSFVSGKAGGMKPGVYQIPANYNAARIADMFSRQPKEIEVVVPDGASVYDVDALLAAKKILPAGFLLSYVEANVIEGKLYPDTYRFFENSTAEKVAGKFLDNFRAKAEPLLSRNPAGYESNLIIASLVQKEVSGENDSRIVAGIIKKRLASGMKLDIDATICYLKKTMKGQTNCYPLEPADFKIESPYNTYLHAGLPPGPIGSPNASAISAAMNPVATPYWFYLSDPKTGRTIFAKTLDEQNANRRIYLR